MVQLYEIPQTAIFSWSPLEPIIATGTHADAIESDFSLISPKLDLWDLSLLSKTSQPKVLASINADARFNAISWSKANSKSPRGLIAGGLVNGKVQIWNPEEVIKQNSNTSATLLSSHTTVVKAIEFNPIQPELLASVGDKSEIFIWDLNKISNAPTQPLKSSSDENPITSLAWSKKLSYILATGSSHGITTVWDLRTHDPRSKEKRTTNGIFQLQTPGVSSIAWNPDTSTKFVTSSSEDNNPVILAWDLRKTSVPEKILTGHSAGILSVDWNVKDANLLISSGKDSRTLMWNPVSGEMLGEYPESRNWSFETKFSSQSPHLFATASLDGKISIQSIQNTNFREAPQEANNAKSEEEFFDQITDSSSKPVFSLKQVPSFYNVPSSAQFGFGGKLVTVGIDTAATKSAGKNKYKVSIKDYRNIKGFQTDATLLEETKEFENLLNKNDLAGLADKRIKESGSNNKDEWEFLKALINKDTKESVFELFGITENNKNINNDNKLNGDQNGVDHLETTKNITAQISTLDLNDQLSQDKDKSSILQL